MLKRLTVGVLLVTLTGCGSTGGDEKAASDPIQNVSAKARDAVVAAQSVDASDFPKPAAGQSIEQFAAQFAGNGPQALAGTSVYRTPGGRIAFGLLDAQQKFNYGPTVVYIAPYKGGKVLGPFPAPADVLLTDPKYRSQQAATEDSPFAAIYGADVPFKKPGVYKVLTVSDLDGRRVAAGMAAQVVSPADDRIPDVGEKAPAVQTDTRGSVHGDLDLLDTREPKAPELSQVSFADVAGKKPVALLFSTPQLCQSRVCGPVTDEMLQVKAETGDKMTFIHQETYADNDIQKGFREPLQRYALQSEPWLFTVDRHGRIAARLEGSIGIRAFREAVKAALK
ncbi:MAG: hypothetical protein QOI80_3021 [Solirubrobacteraceae bacterium]|nr:hypothetical protein [Solirubrobacteraceae bacterium]